MHRGDTVQTPSDETDSAHSRKRVLSSDHKHRWETCHHRRGIRKFRESPSITGKDVEDEWESVWVLYGMSCRVFLFGFFP